MPEKYPGLSTQVAAQALLTHGPNVLPEKPPPSSLALALSQLKSPLVYVLILAGFVTFYLKEYPDTTIIALAVFVNTILGFIQEKRANEALSALKKMLHPTARVVRDGEIQNIDVSGIVPGDIIALRQGDKISGDGEVLSSTRLFVAEAILTGESSPVGKSAKDEVYMGTTVTSGSAYFRVAKTGASTKMGEIAVSIQDTQEETPLRRQLQKLSKQLSVLVLVLTIVVFIIGVLSGRAAAEIFTTSVALAVSAIPEGLLVALTVILAIGMQRILKRKGLVRNLVSAETLGGVTTICVDKTGTLTEGSMKVVRHVGDEKALSIQAILSNDREDPITIAAWEWANRTLSTRDLEGEKLGGYMEKYERIDTSPFSSHDRFSATLHKHRKKNLLLVNGAPDYLLEWCRISKKEKEEVTDLINQLTTQGMRILGMARKDVSLGTSTISNKLVKSDLHWVGILAFSDPPRSGVREALGKAKAAGIRTIVITGDYAQTALSVLHKLGITVPEKNIFLGEGLETQDDNKLSTVLLGREPMLFARTTPDQKLKIVNALKKNGEVVAMTGDGVNDAPALSQADIGIAVEEASDVSKESADLVLLDSSFQTIVTAVEEGRGIFDNIRKVILYLLSDAFSEIIAVLGAIILGLPLPVTATQILWINLVSDGFPNLALTVDPKRAHAMLEKPRSPKEPLVNRWMFVLIALVSIFSGISALVLFTYIHNATKDILLARSVAFATLGVNSLVYVFSIRALRRPVWRSSLFNNPWLIAGVIGGAILQIIPFVYAPAGNFFNVVPLPPIYWIYVAGVTGMMLILIEVSKVVMKK